MYRYTRIGQQGLPPMFLLGIDSSGERDSIEPKYYFTSLEQVEEYVRGKFNYLDDIRDFKVDDMIHFTADDGGVWDLSIFPLEKFE